MAGGDEIMAAIAALAARFELVVITQDWHPRGPSLVRQQPAGRAAVRHAEMDYGAQVLWPDHCVQGTPGADFHPGLARRCDARASILRKGYQPGIDSYSAFYENDRSTATGLAGYLRDKGVKRCVFVGLAYDFCVAWSALDAVREGFEAAVLKPLTRAIAMGGPDGTNTVAPPRPASAAPASTLVE